MRGKLYGIGTGPGDPGLLTIKAVDTIRECDVIAVPESGSGERTAFLIAEKYIGDKDILECRFEMEHDILRRKASRQNVADSIAGLLDDGKKVGFITLGDPTTYSTYMYVHEIVTGRGYEAEIVPGITSISAAAAALGIALCEGNETLTLISGHGGDLDSLLRRPGNKVIMKSGASFPKVLEKLKEHGYGNRTKIACRVTMDAERLFRSIEDYEESSETDYFTVAIVKE